MTAITAIPFNRIDGTRATLADYAGSVVLVVNVASKCGLTPQYEGLEKLYEHYRGRGLVVLGFPANNFAGQEPGTHAEIMEFCRGTYGVQFPLAEKISVTGGDIHPLYAALTAARPETTGRAGSGLLERLNSKNLGPESDTAVMWNFEKFLVDRKGEVVARLSPDIAPDDPRLVTAIEAALG